MNPDPISLVHGYLDGELTAAQRSALAEWLDSDQGNVDRFVAECRVHSELCDKQWGTDRAGRDEGLAGFGIRDPSIRRPFVGILGSESVRESGARPEKQSENDGTERWASRAGMRLK